MKLGDVASGAVQLLNLYSWRSVWDFDAPGLTRRVQLERLYYAVLQAKHQCGTPECEPELQFAMSECERLMALPELDGEAAESQRVQQRIERVTRIVTYHEGHLARLNRRYWWVPFSLVLLVMAAAVLPGLAALLEEL